MNDLQALLQTKYCSLDEATIIRMNNNDNSGALNNVITGLEKHCYGMMLIDDSNDLHYRLFYVADNKRLRGDMLELFASEKERDELTFMFAKYLSQEYTYLDIIDTFNTFQRQTRTLLEKYDFLTYNPMQFKKYGDSNPLIITKGKKGIKPVLEIDKIIFYKDFFGHTNSNDYQDGVNFIYVMLNARNGLLKIGHSKRPYFREKTLQAEEPEVHLIALWKAPKIIERDLHKQFGVNRKRGEWFSLPFNQLEFIKQQMKIYE